MKVGHFERTFRAKCGNRGRKSVGMIQGQEDHDHDDQEGIEMTCHNTRVRYDGYGLYTHTDTATAFVGFRLDLGIIYLYRLDRKVKKIASHRR